MGSGWQWGTDEQAQNLTTTREFLKKQGEIGKSRPDLPTKERPGEVELRVRQIFVGGLKSDFTRETLISFFRSLGYGVENAWISPDTKKSFGFVTFSE